MKCLIRLVQWHESFRKAELGALAVLASVSLKILEYSNESPFCIAELSDEESACKLVQRGILISAIYEFWGKGKTYQELHDSVKSNEAIEPHKYKASSFRFEVDSFQRKRNTTAQRELIESFSYLPFDGPILMNNADLEMCIFEDYPTREDVIPSTVYLGRLLAQSGRKVKEKYDLKKRVYINRTSMDAELSLVTANIALAAPGKIIYDPFVGTGSFAVAAAHFGAQAFGSDIDSRSIRGTPDKNLFSNFVQYNIASNFLDSFIADLTHCPLRVCQMLDGIVCDPPYGIREGPKILGNKFGKDAELVLVDGKPAHLNEDYIAPKRAYGFKQMLEDVLDFAFLMLVDHGRLCIWIPTADDDEQDLSIPAHPGLEQLSSCVQQFNKWSRQLVTYQRLPENLIKGEIPQRKREQFQNGTADELNPFRKKYFQGFRDPAQ